MAPIVLIMLVCAYHDWGGTEHIRMECAAELVLGCAAAAAAAIVPTTGQINEWVGKEIRMLECVNHLSHHLLLFSSHSQSREIRNDCYR